MALDIEEKFDSTEKLAAIAGKPTKNYLFALEVNKIVQAVDGITETLENINEINTIILDNGFSKVDNLFTGLADTLWNINGVRYTNSSNQAITIPLCATGMVRTDRVILDTNNNFVIIPGVEVAENPVAEAKPANTLDYTLIPVKDTEVGDPTPPILGSNFNKKIYDNFYTYTGTGTDVVIPLPHDGQSNIYLSGSMTSVAGFDFSEFLANPTNAEYPHTGKNFMLTNLSGHDITLLNGVGTLDVFFDLIGGTDLVIPDGKSVFFNGNTNVFVEINRNWIDTSNKLDKVTTNDVEKVYIKNADGTQGMKPVSEFGGGGSVQSVTGDSVDNTDALNPIINAIPLSGTTVGNPVTGDLEFDSGISIFTGVTNFQSAGDEFISTGFRNFRSREYFIGLNNEDEVPEMYFYKDKDNKGKVSPGSIEFNSYGNSNSIRMNSVNDGIFINSSDPNSRGLIGEHDFTPNITDLDYVQKKYVDTKVPKVTSSGVERAYIINSDGTQSTKPTSDFGTVKGTGTINRISKFTASGTIGDSQIFDDGTKVGIGTTSPQARLDVRAQGVLNTDIVLRVRNSTDTQNFLVVNGAGDVYNNGAGGVNSNTFFGENVGRNATGAYNTAIGRSALRNNTTGYSNAAIGVSALQNNTTGNSNTAIGVSALYANTTGNSNTAIGESSLYANTTGVSNTAIGVSALQYNTTGNSNAAIGVSALQYNTTGVSNTAIGPYALLANTAGYSNAAIGVNALQYNTTGNSNAAIGVSAGSLISNGSNNTITNSSIFIGRDTRALADNQTNQIVIGYNATGLGSNSVVLGNTSITITQLRGQVIMGAFNSAPTGIEGAIYYDSTTKKHYGFDGITWNALY